VLPGDILPRSFYDRDVVLVAQELLGKLIVRRVRAGVCIGRIVATEAYLADGDPACHSFRGKTKKNATMFGRPGLVYVYSIHARYCMNAVTETKGRASAVLIRAIEPLVGIDVMQRQRGVEKATDLCRGPARLCEALDVDRRIDGWDITRGQRLWVAEAGGYSEARTQVTRSPRIGVTSAQELRLRFFKDGSAYVSGPKHLHTNRQKPRSGVGK
jgi:DNA-3-methyladenine glycosylase